MNNHTKKWKEKQLKFRKEQLGSQDDDFSIAINQCKDEQYMDRLEKEVFPVIENFINFMLL